MIQSLMNWYGRTPPRLQRWLRHWFVMPTKRLFSHGVIVQDGFVLAKRLDQSIPFKLWHDRFYEPHLSRLFREYLRSGDTFIDVGANIGYFTLLAAACVGPNGRVHSFEPNSRVIAELKRNVALNRFSQVISNNVALSNRAERVEMYIAPEMDSGLSSMRRTSGLLTETQTVHAITLDEYVTQNHVDKIRAMKLDVEGAEWLVLQGAQTLLASANRPDVIALESVQSHAAAFNTATIEVARHLAKYGYELYLLGNIGDSFQLNHLKTPNQVSDGTLVAMIDHN